MSKKVAENESEYGNVHSASDTSSRYMNEGGSVNSSESANEPVTITQRVAYGEDQGGLFDWFRNKFGKKKQEEPMEISGPMDVKGFVNPYADVSIDPSKAGKVNTDRNLQSFWNDDVQHHKSVPKGLEGAFEELLGKYSSAEYGGENAINSHVTHAGDNWNTGGLNKQRLMVLLTKSEVGEGLTREQIDKLIGKLSASVMPDLDKSNPEAVSKADSTVDSGMMDLKRILYRSLKRAEATYGTMGTQMHPEDFMRQIGTNFNGHLAMTQDTEQLLVNAPHLFDFENSEEDRDFKRLSDYYNQLYMGVNQYGLLNDQGDLASEAAYMQLDQANPEGIQGPSMDEKAQAKYNTGLRKRASKGGWFSRLLGRFN